MTDIAQISFSFPAIRSKKVTAAFDGGAITSDAGVLLLAQPQHSNPDQRTWKRERMALA